MRRTRSTITWILGCVLLVGVAVAQAWGQPAPGPRAGGAGGRGGAGGGGGGGAGGAGGAGGGFGYPQPNAYSPGGAQQPGAANYYGARGGVQQFGAVQDEEVVKKTVEVTQKFEALDQQIHQAAIQYRELKGEEKANAKQKLLELVAQQFDLRQQLREVQIEQLKKRLEAVQSSATKRKELKEKIVTNRVGQLLGEASELDWDSADEGGRNLYSPQYAPAPQYGPAGGRPGGGVYGGAGGQGGAGGAPGAPGAPGGAGGAGGGFGGQGGFGGFFGGASGSEGSSANLTPASGGGSGFGGPSGGFGAGFGSRSTPGAAQHHRTIAEAEAAIALAKSRYEEAIKSLKEGAALDQQKLLYQSTIDRAVLELERAQQRLESEKKELEFDIREAEAELQEAAAELKQAEANAASTPGTNVDSPRAKVNAKQIRVDRVRAKLEQYLQESKPRPSR